jgi:hypothetical protein
VDERFEGIGVIGNITTMKEKEEFGDVAAVAQGPEQVVMGGPNPAFAGRGSRV